MSQERAKRTFADLRVGDVLVNLDSDSDVGLVLRVGERVDFYHLIDGRYLESWVAAESSINSIYEIIRDGEVLK